MVALVAGRAPIYGGTAQNCGTVCLKKDEAAVQGTAGQWASVLCSTPNYYICERTRNAHS